MCLDSNLKIEVISSVLGQILQPYDKKRCGRADILSVDDFYLNTIIGKRKSYVKELFIDEEEFFDPQFDCDFTDFSDSAECRRGDEPYERPKGWYRMALKVRGKYPDGDTWLGTNGWRSYSVPGEWPVSYHGTSLAGAKGIIRSHYKAGDGDVYGRGIYSTPDIHVAEREEYAKTFTSKTTGKNYKVILQNRINPEKRKICQRSDYWLIPVHKRASAKEEKQIVESSIRPYGILIKELNDDDDDDDDTGDEDKGDDDSGDEDSGDDDTCDDDNSDDDRGDDDRGDDDSGDDDNSDDDRGDDDRGDDDSGDDDNSDDDRGDDDNSDDDSDDDNSDDDTGDEDNSDDDRGDDDRGDDDTGDDDNSDDDRGNDDSADDDGADDDSSDDDNSDDDSGDDDRDDDDNSDDDRGNDDGADDDSSDDDSSDDDSSDDDNSDDDTGDDDNSDDDSGDDDSSNDHASCDDSCDDD
ncbi:serine-aspartate repeat-containing protein D [Trachinotus anak]|uniref:serine-aspartate repeat-containing protein D n=1 Tax=Trachinotus anak TaxID=443729 RepID=UPI0039F25F94